MAEFIGGEEKLINKGEPIVFENNTDSDYEVNMSNTLPNWISVKDQLPGSTKNGVSPNGMTITTG